MCSSVFKQFQNVGFRNKRDQTKENIQPGFEPTQVNFDHSGITLVCVNLISNIVGTVGSWITTMYNVQTVLVIYQRVVVPMAPRRKLDNSACNKHKTQSKAVRGVPARSTHPPRIQHMQRARAGIWGARRESKPTLCFLGRSQDLCYLPSNQDDSSAVL